jgi:hypothetical protein
VRSYYKIFYKNSGPPNYADTFYGRESDIADGHADYVLAMYPGGWSKDHFVRNLNSIQYAQITYWGNSMDPNDVIPQWFKDACEAQGLGPLDLVQRLTNNLVRMNPDVWFPGVFIPYVGYANRKNVGQKNG